MRLIMLSSPPVLGQSPSLSMALPTANTKDMVKLDGDLVLGGLFPLHDAGDEKTLCGAIKEEKGIQRMEAMLFAVDQINRDHKLLTNLTLGTSLLEKQICDIFN